MAEARFHTDDLLRPVLARAGQRASIQWEGEWENLEPVQTVRRRDRVLSRARWQFVEREEHQAHWNDATPAEGGTDVSEHG